ncbi:GNAT family N-acetyltransferase [Opitutus sp. ER46]|nr:GNAT family N-acetyltransferase [Opitutus sp. ER46]
MREFTLADFETATALWRVSEGVGLNEADSREGITLFLTRNPGLSVVVTAADGTLVAAVLCGHDGRRGYLHHLAVAKSHRGRGLGSAIVRDCLSRLRRAGIQKCNIFLYATNAAGREFWLHQRWTSRGDLVVLQRSTGA